MTKRKSKPKAMDETELQTADTAPPAVRSTDLLEQLAATEDELMKAATDFGRMWGCDQTSHPKMYWLELHIERWRRLSAAAVKYSEAVCNASGGTAHRQSQRESI